MPRVKNVDYRRKDLTDIIRSHMAIEKVTQTMLAEKMNKAQSTICVLLQNGKWSLDDYWFLVDYFHFTQEEILKTTKRG